MDWRVAVSLAVLPLALFSQLRTRRLNIVALLVSPVIYLILGAVAARSASAAGLGLLWPLGLFGGALTIGVGQGTVAVVFYDPPRRDYRQRGGLLPLAFWAAALLLREVAAYLATRGLSPAQAHQAMALTIDAALGGLLTGRALTLVCRHPALLGASLEQLWGEGVAAPGERRFQSGRRA